MTGTVVPTLVITGPPGVGKTRVSFEILERLESARIPHAFIDTELTYFFPEPDADPAGQRIGLRALAGLWRVYCAASLERLILARTSWWSGPAWCGRLG